MFYLFEDRAAHEAAIVEAAPEMAWPYEPWGWTYQSIAPGSHFSCTGEYENEEEANAALRAATACDAVERGAYCYAHNRIH